MPKVSVLIPAYNVELYIKECLDSVLSQTFSDFEIICVDDASTDNTLNILKEYEKKDDRIHILTHKCNKGQSCGRNYALTNAVGRYVYMLDADDMLVPDALEILVSTMDKNNLDVVGFETKQFAKEDIFLQAAAIKTINYPKCNIMNGEEALYYCMKNDCFSLSTPTFMMRREYLSSNNIRFVEGILHEDVGYILHLISRAKKITFINDVLFLRRIRAKSTMTTKFSSRNIEGYLKSFYQSFSIIEIMSNEYEHNENFRWALNKWQRDIWERLNQLYKQNEETIYFEKGGSIDKEIQYAFETIKVNSSGKSKSIDIFGPSLCEKIINESKDKKIYLIGTGSYTKRAIDYVAALDIPIAGIIVLEKNARSFNGFPLFTVDEINPDTSAILLSTSHYHIDEYIALFNKLNFNDLIELKF